MMKGTSKITNSGALGCLKMLKDKNLRAKISPDGQFIRTTKLPKYAKYYPYVLASFPNTYYDWEFQFEGQSSYNPNTGVRTAYKKIDDYAAPIDIDMIKDFEDFSAVKDEYLDVWVSKVRTYMENVFNVDYRTINNEWIETILSTDYSSGHEAIRVQAKTEIEQYVSDMKNNKTVIESTKVSVDGSSLYFFNGAYFLRTYVKYRIMSSNVKYGVDTDTLILERPYNDILYTRTTLVDFTGYKLGEWREGHFDVKLSWYTQKEGGNIGICNAYLNEYSYSEGRTDK
jgi:hypothetical protein